MTTPRSLTATIDRLVDETARLVADLRQIRADLVKLAEDTRNLAANLPRDEYRAGP